MKQSIFKFIKQNTGRILLFAVIIGYFAFKFGTGQCPITAAGNWLSGDNSDQDILATTEGSVFNLVESGMTFSFLDGSSLDASDLKGSPTVINYWATWCGPCRKELPGFNKVAEAEKGKVNFIGISLDKDAMAVKRFLEKTPLSFSVAHGETRLMKFTGSVRSIPTTLFFDKEGNYRGTHTGYLSAQQLGNKINSL